MVKSLLSEIDVEEARNHSYSQELVTVEQLRQQTEMAQRQLKVVKGPPILQK